MSTSRFAPQASNPAIVKLWKFDGLLSSKVQDLKLTHQQLRLSLRAERANVAMKQRTLAYATTLKDAGPDGPERLLIDLHESKKLVDSLGGIDAVRKIESEMDQRKQQQQCVALPESEAVQVARLYTRTLSGFALQRRRVYRIMWKGLVDWFSGASLRPVYSFALLLDEFDLARDFTSNITHMFNGTGALYLSLALDVFSKDRRNVFHPFDPNTISLVTTENVLKMCDSVFNESNVYLLRTHDGVRESQAQAYRSRLISDSTELIRLTTNGTDMLVCSKSLLTRSFEYGWERPKTTQSPPGTDHDEETLVMTL
jgi:hypothetical protein